jgi:hypothetical protein
MPVSALQQPLKNHGKNQGGEIALRTSAARLTVQRADPVIRLSTIQQHLAEYPAADGWEVVVVNHPDRESTTL